MVDGTSAEEKQSALHFKGINGNIKTFMRATVVPVEDCSCPRISHQQGSIHYHLCIDLKMNNSPLRPQEKYQSGVILSTGTVHVTFYG